MTYQGISNKRPASFKRPHSISAWGKLQKLAVFWKYLWFSILFGRQFSHVTKSCVFTILFSGEKPIASFAGNWGKIISSSWWLEVWMTRSRYHLSSFWKAKSWSSHFWQSHSSQVFLPGCSQRKPKFTETVTFTGLKPSLGGWEGGKFTHTPRCWFYLNNS